MGPLYQLQMRFLTPRRETLPSRQYYPAIVAEIQYLGLSHFLEWETLIIATLTDIENTIYMR